MRGSLLDSVIRGFGRRIAWLVVVLVLAGISAGARLVWNQMNPSSRTITIPEKGGSVASARSRIAPAQLASTKPGVPVSAAAPSAHPVSAAAKSPANATPGVKAPANPTSGVTAAAGAGAPGAAAKPSPASTLASKPGAIAAAASKPGSPAPAPAAYGPPAPAAAPAGLQAAAASATSPAITSRPVSAAQGPSAKSAPGAALASHLDEQLTYQYETVGRRDPFQPIVGGGFVASDVGGDAPMDIGGVKVVGIVWGDEDKFAMVEDARGQSNVLRVGDRIQNGVVTGLKKDGVIVTLTIDGQSQTVTIPLTKKGDQSNGNR